MRLPRAATAGGTLAWAGWIWWNSSREGRLVVDPSFGSSWFTNLGHAPAFAFIALGALAASLPRPPASVHRAGPTPPVSPRLARAVVLATCAYGAIDEVHQSFVYGRTATLFDLLTDAAGVLATVAVVAYLAREDADAQGLRRRLGWGSLACIASALAATVSDFHEAGHLG